MRCKNRVEVWVERGFHGKMIELNCGNTNQHGVVELCYDCDKKSNQQYPQGWRHHPGDTCKHGVYLNPEHDCSCHKCEGL